jgi:hypothetical protein
LRKKRENEQEGASPPFVPRKFSPTFHTSGKDLPNLDRIIVIISVNDIIIPEYKTNRNNIEIRIEMV